VTEKPPKPKTPGRDIDVHWGQYLGIGLQILVGVVLGFFAGDWLDRRYGWTPWGVLIGVMLGLAGGMYLLIKDAIRINKD
jgi:F0F1-type ATP synthase assembly protein I